MAANLLDDWKNLGAGRVNEVNPSSAFPLLRWMSGKPDNLEACAYINEKFFYIPPKMVISLLYLTGKSGFFKYPKKSAEEKDDKFYILMKESTKKLYNWSELEYKKNKIVVEPLFNDEKYVQELATRLGFTKEECKIAGIKFEVKKYEYRPKSTIDIFSFM